MNCTWPSGTCPAAAPMRTMLLPVQSTSFWLARVTSCCVLCYAVAWIETSVAEAADESQVSCSGVSRMGSLAPKTALMTVHTKCDCGWHRLCREKTGSGWARFDTSSLSGSSLTRIDPDADYARHFALQSLVYGQSVEKLGWVAGTEIVPRRHFGTISSGLTTSPMAIASFSGYPASRSRQRR